MSAVQAVEPKASAQAGLAPEVLLRGLYERHSDRVFAFCIRRLSNRPEAEDAVQNTFLNAFRALQRGVVPLNEKAWLFKIAENVCLETHRSNGRRQAHELGHDPDVLDRVAARDGDTETARALRQALGALPASQRRALLLREWRGLSYREIAGQLGTSVAAVETLIFRARKSVARHLERESSLGRLAGILNLGQIASAIKGAFTGAAALQVAAAATVLTLATVPAGDSSTQSVAGGAAAPSRASTDEAQGRPEQPDGPAKNAARGGLSGTAGAGAVAGSGSGGLRPGRPGTESSDPAAPGRDEVPGAPASPGQPGTTQPGQPNSPGPETRALPTPAVPPLPTVTPPPGVPQLPELPRVEVPQLPPAPLPPLPQTPELPKLPEVPPLPQLPAQPPPALPKLG
jgi:RNA polymerase sigma-70 factor (ECF subfamily)